MNEDQFIHVINEKKQIYYRQPPRVWASDFQINLFSKLPGFKSLGR